MLRLVRPLESMERQKKIIGALSMENGIVAYYRVSTQKQGVSGLGLEAQENTVRQYAARHKAQIIAEFSEVESGRKNHRPGLLQAINHCKQTGALLVIAKLDRLSRDLAFIVHLQNSGVKFVACDMPEANSFTIQIMAAFAQHEASLIAERTKKALEAKRARGWQIGRNHTFTAEQQAKSVETIKRNARENDNSVRAMYLIENELKRGASLNQIAAKLTEHKYMTAKNSTVWTAKAVSRLAERAGLYTEKKRVKGA